MTKIKFTKMHGAGNDYIYVDTSAYPISYPEQVSIEWSKFHFGIGSDGLILIGKSDVADFSMRIFNNDGTEAMMCGNGIRCVGKFVYDHKLTDRTYVSIDTLSGIKYVELHTTDGKVTHATVDMGEPILENKRQLATVTGGACELEISDGESTYCGTFVCMGNPHFVIFVDSIEKIDLPGTGRKLEFNPLFPERCNIEFAQVLSDGRIRMRVWERGSGITNACGTGACATAVAAALTKRSGHTSTIVMDGGELTIEWKSDNHIFMTGPATTVFEGEIEL